jgi:hypothetical protein
MKVFSFQSTMMAQSTQTNSHHTAQKQNRNKNHMIISVEAKKPLTKLNITSL